jgi:hypothetical protein
MIKIPKPTALSFPVTPTNKVRFGIEFTGNLTNLNRLKQFRKFVYREENPKRVSFITTDGTNFFEPLGILKKEIRSNDPQADAFLKIFQTDNKNAKITRVLFFREEGTTFIDKPLKKAENIITQYKESQDNFIILGLIIAGVTIAILSSKKPKR